MEVAVSKKCDFASIDCSGVVERLVLRGVGLLLRRGLVLLLRKDWLLRGVGLLLRKDWLVVGWVFLLLAELES